MLTLKFPLQPSYLLISFFLIVALSLPFVSQAQSRDNQNPSEATRIFLLGEIHDNPNGHSLRFDLVMQLILQGKNPVVAMEQFDRENQASLDLALTICKDVDCVLDTAGSPGWDWRFYKPLVQLALDKKITLVAANLSNADVRKVMGGGYSAVFSPQAIAKYNIDQHSNQLLSIQRKSIREGHCNMLPLNAIDPMVQGQIARDVWMASVINRFDDRTVILIAGNGHVRKDVGVFQWLYPENQSQTQVHGYVERSEKSDGDWFDHVHLTRTIDREDPCHLFTKTPLKK